MPNAKIVCTLGPATDSFEQVTALAEAGLSVARLNASHGSPEHRRETISLSRSITAVQPSDRVLLDDGRIETIVERAADEVVFARVENGGVREKASTFPASRRDR